MESIVFRFKKKNLFLAGKGNRMMYAPVVNCLLKCMEHTGAHKYVKGLTNYLKLPGPLLK